MNDDANRKERAALASIFASAALTLGKLVAGLASGSLALLSDAAHGLVDTGATVITYFAIRVSGKPPDEDHNWGHAKVEAVAALAEAGVLMAIALAVLIEALRRLAGEPAVVDATPLAFGVLVVAIVVDLVRWRALSRLARETKSDALPADAMHFSSDCGASALALVGLVAVRYGVHNGDALASVAIALLIAVAGWRLGRATVDTLLDTAPEGAATRVREAAGAVPGVATIDSVRLRPAGATVLGELAISVARTLPMDKVRAIKEDVGAAILKVLPDAEITVTANPRALDDETMIERVLLVAANRRLPVHHITCHRVDGDRVAVSLDVEIDGRMRLGAAHRQASALEAAIAAALGPGVEVETHIEPLQVHEVPTSEAGAAERDAVVAALEEGAAAGGVVGDVHDVRVRLSEAGLVVSYHCHADPSLPVDTVHAAVDALDRRVRGRFDIPVRIVGHAEPKAPPSDAP